MVGGIVPSDNLCSTELHFVLDDFLPLTPTPPSKDSVGVILYVCTIMWRHVFILPKQSILVISHGNAFSI